MNKETENVDPNSERKITRRELLKGAGILGAVPVVDSAHDKAVIRGTVRYPWGMIKKAQVTAEEKSVYTDSEGSMRSRG